MRSARRSASQRELAIRAAARLTIQRVAHCTPGMRPRLATSCPWAITTSGAFAARAASAPAAPAGKRKCANTTSGGSRRAAATALRMRRRYSVCDPPRRLIAATLTSCSCSSNARASGMRKLPRSGSAGLGHIWVTSKIRTVNDCPVDLEDPCHRRVPVGSRRPGRLIASSHTARAASRLARSGRRSATQAAPEWGSRPRSAAIPWMRLAAELLAGAGEHLAHRLAAADADEVERGLSLAAGLAPDPLGELADGQARRARAARRAASPSAASSAA